MPQEDRPTRDYVVTVFVTHQGRVALLYDDSTGALAAPSGHIRPEELPGEAAVRVVLSLTGMPVELVRTDAHSWQPAQLPRPEGLMLESITPSHEHIGLIYFARPAMGIRPRLSGEIAQLRWFDRAELAELELPRHLAGWALQAITVCTPAT
jgi:ADP-ribose pyrophosphatase YjhB (NUDIX family)